MTHTILVTDFDFSDLSIERDQLPDSDVEIVEGQARSEADLVETVKEVKPDALLNQYAPVTRAIFEAHSGIQAVGRYGIGVDTVDLDAATEHGVVTLNVPDYCLDEVPTHTMALILSVKRNTAQYTAEIKSGTWNWTNGQPIYRLRGQTLGLAGFGKLPKNLVDKAKPFGLEPIAYDPYVTEEEMAEHNVEKVSFDELLERSDIVSVHTPLTDETREMFDTEAFTAMDEDAIIVNTSRGSTIDVDALHEALVNSELRGAGIDVMPDEPPEHHPLFELDETVMTPHVAWYSEESIGDMRGTVAEDVYRVLEGETPINPVNEEVLN
ncbi:C-terminal binding protein [Halostagnicola kamekurae]|uniref:D-3-phosphoglycerate dehydrogenase n=1 Tax=Halostagnicola kamekurae TaxID=619731 RepID=A0A1I6V1G4_9EURY|nr:C-terminal binding protein [Halostagnicola kamekurae]SFT07561.1 D-3-phosphoglycerate dehydrogenase [Halostagnicola kamekurae]